MGIRIDPVVTFPVEELALLNNTDFLLAKQKISIKLIEALSGVERDLHEFITTSGFVFPENAFVQAGKIAKGENYLGLPYFILDYPRLFTKKEVFALRTMIWWGHELSCTLHLEGACLDPYKEQLPNRLSVEKDLYFCVNDTPWEFHYQPDNFIRVNELSISDMIDHIKSTNFIKISNRLPMDEWNSYKSFVLENFARFLRLLNPI